MTQLGASAIETDALAALLDKIGPAVVVVHSLSGPLGMGMAVSRPKLAKGLVTVEPISCAAPDGDIARTFDHVPVLAVSGDFKDAYIDRVPTPCGDLVTRMKAAGQSYCIFRRKDSLETATCAMMDRNNLKVAEGIISWLRDDVK